MGASLLAHLAMLAGFIWLAGAQASHQPAVPAGAVTINLLPGPPPGRGQDMSAPAGVAAAPPSPEPPPALPARQARLEPPQDLPPRRPAPRAQPAGLAPSPQTPPPASAPATPAQESGALPEAGEPAGPATGSPGASPAGASQGVGDGAGLGLGSSQGQGGSRHGGGPDIPPRPLSRTRPAYPAQARHLGVEGRVLVRILVDQQGRVAVVKILAAEPPGHFEEAVSQSVAAWDFRPAEKDGRAVEAWLDTTIRFRLED